MPRAVILTALPVEYSAVRAHLTDVREETHPQGTVYERGKFAGNGQVWEVGIAEVGAGNAGAAVEAERAIAYFKPEILFFIGIAGGIKDVAIGDVVAATKVYGYESGKVANQFLTRPALGQSAYALVQRAKSEARKGSWLQRLSNSPASQPRVFVAPIAAGEKVVASKESDVFNFIRTSYDDAIAIEMEGFGFLSAAFAYPNIKAIVIRGISDLVEGKNDDSIEPEQVRQEKASYHASAFAFEVLAKLELKNRFEETGDLPTPVKQLSSEELISDIASQDPLTAGSAAQLLGNHPDLIPAVIEVLPNSPVTIEAIRTVLRDHPEQSAKLLMKRLNDADKNSHIAFRAAAYFDPSLTPFCEAELGRNLSGSWFHPMEVKRLSIEALGRCGSSGWGYQLRDLLSGFSKEDLDEDRNVKLGRYVVEALARFFVRSVNEPGTPISSSSENLRDELIRQYQHGMHVSCTPLDDCNGRHADVLIRDWLSSEVPKVVGIAANILGRCQIVRAVKPLIEVMKTRQETYVIHECSSALGHIGTREAMEFLLATSEISDKNFGLIFALDKIDEVSVFQKAVIQLLDMSQSLRYLTLRAIGRRRDQSFEKVLRTALEGSDELERGTAALALARLGGSVSKDYFKLSLEQSSNLLERILTALAIITVDSLAYSELKSQLRYELSKESYNYDFAIQTDILEVLLKTQDLEAIELANAWRVFYKAKPHGKATSISFT